MKEDIADRLNSYLRILEPDPLKATWYTLFRKMDLDRSGLITFDEFLSMTRRTLKVPVTAITDRELMAVWRAIDVDGNGYVTAGEFGRFLKTKGRSEPRVLQRPSRASWRVRDAEQKLRVGRAVKAETERLLGRSGAAHEAVSAGESDLVQLATAFTAKMCEIFAGTSMEWFKLFREVDSDGSGHISFNELQKMVRELLRMSPQEMPVMKLHSLWAALDADHSGLVSAAEFGRFMAKGSHLLAPADGLTWRPRMLQARERMMSAYRRAETARLDSWRERERRELLERKQLTREVKQELADGLRRGAEQLRQNATEARGAVREMLMTDMPEIDLSDVEPASPELALEISQLLNKQLRNLPTKSGAMGNNQAAHVSWFKLFQEVDLDGSGLLSFSEWEALVRDAMRMSVSALPDSSLQSIWRSIDEDDSGHITVAELAKFMKLGEHVIPPPTPWRERAQAANRAAAAEVVAETDRLVGIESSQGKRSDPTSTYNLGKLVERVELGHVLTSEEVQLLKQGASARSAAAESTVVALSTRLNDRMAEMEPDPLKRSWFALFKQIDVDRSGRISMDEFRGVVRNELKISPDEIHEAELQSLWLALDADLSGFVTAGEFGAFMRKGEPVVEKPSNLEVRFQNARRERAKWDAKAAAATEEHISILKDRAAAYNAASAAYETERERLRARPSTSSSMRSTRDGIALPTPPSTPRDGTRSARVDRASTPQTRSPRWAPPSINPMNPRPSTGSPRVARAIYTAPSEQAQMAWSKRPESRIGLPRSMFKPVLVKNAASGAAVEVVSYRLDLKRMRRRAGRYDNW